MLLYICCRSYRGRLFTTSGWCIGKLLPDLDILSAMSMSFHVCSRGGGGGDLTTCGGWGGGGPSDGLMFSPGDLFVWGCFVN